MRVLIAIVGALSTALGQSLLINILFPSFVAVYGLWILAGLLFLNVGLAGIFLLLHGSLNR